MERIDFKQSAGKTIKNVVSLHDQLLLVVFTDGSQSLMAAWKPNDSEAEIDTFCHYKVEDYFDGEELKACKL